MISEGETAPEFAVPGMHPDSKSIEEFRLSDGLSDGPVLLVFYPFDFSPVCADQLCTFRDMEWVTFTENADVWGISVDSAHCHEEFMAEYDLGFPLLSDRLGDVAAEYDLLMEEFEQHKNVPKRSIVSIDQSRTVRFTWEAESQYHAPSIETVENAIAWFRQQDP
jgi:peroxiredoxin